MGVSEKSSWHTYSKQSRNTHPHQTIPVSELGESAKRARTHVPNILANPVPSAYNGRANPRPAPTVSHDKGSTWNRMEHKINPEAQAATASTPAQTHAAKKPLSLTLSQGIPLGNHLAPNVSHNVPGPVQNRTEPVSALRALADDVSHALADGHGDDVRVGPHPVGHDGGLGNP